ncbi:PREDICTED: early growth response protein 1-like, partial [Papilio polytes]|uniref:early growth response protein 1-like n=1 Tax=Papilio polytes TaxID=76194 RepID=UPI0006761D69
CDETFSTRQEIVYHLKVHSGSRTVKSETDKKFPCDYCDRKFFTAKDVRRHLVVHTGRRDFLCPYCPQKFGRKDHLVRHVKNAHPEKSWRSAAVGTSSEPPPEASAFEESFSDFPIEDVDFKIWNPTSPKAGTSEGRTRVPSTDIIVEMPTDLDIKVEPLEIKQEQQTSPAYEPFGPEYEVFVIPSPFPATPSNLPYIPQPLSDPEHLLNPDSVVQL